MAKARLETVITGDDAPFVAAVARAEKRAQTFSSRIQSLFRRDPSRRAERAITGFITDLSAGNVQGAIGGITTRLSGLGLAAGVGVGAAVEIFIKAKTQLDEVDKSVAKLQADLARPLSFQSALGPEGISKEIEKTKTDLDAVVEKRQGFFQKLREAATQGAPDTDFNTTTLKVEKVDKSLPALHAQMEAISRIRILENERANAELDIAKTKDLAVHSSEEDAALLKTHLDYSKRIAEINLASGLNKPGRDQGVLFKRLAAAKQEHTAIVDAAFQRFDLNKKESESQNRILDLQDKGLSKDQLSLAVLRERIALKKKELEITQTDEGKRKVGTELRELTNQVNEAGFQESLKPQSQRVAERNAAQLLQGDKERFQKEQDRTGGLENPHFGIGGNLIGGTDPATGKKVDITGNDSFNQFFHGGLIPDTGPAKGAGEGKEGKGGTYEGGDGTPAEILQSIDNKMGSLLDTWR